MSAYDKKMASDKASKELEEELKNAKPGVVNRFKVNVSHLINKCTFGKAGTEKPKSNPCPGLKK